MGPLVAPVFITHRGCPHRCVFCNQHAVAGPGVAPGDVAPIVREFIARARPRPQNQVHAAFYGGSFTAMEAKTQELFLKEAFALAREGLIGSIRVSTRPDALDEESLALLMKYGVKTVELGAQSLNDDVLSRSRRGHTAQDTVAAVHKLKGLGFTVGIQLMAGLPGDTPSSFLESVEKTVSLAPDLVRIYPALVIRGTELQRMHEAGEYSPLSVEHTVELLAGAVARFDAAGIRVARLGLPEGNLFARGDIIAGPAHPALGYLVRAEVSFRAVTALLNEEDTREKSLTIEASPRHLSEVKGEKGANIEKLRAKFGLEKVEVIAREGLGRNEYRLIWG